MPEANAGKTGAPTRTSAEATAGTASASAPEPATTWSDTSKRYHITE